MNPLSWFNADSTPYRKNNYKNKTLQVHQLWRRHLRSRFRFCLCSLVSCLPISSWCIKIKFTSQMKIQSVSTRADGKTRRCSCVLPEQPRQPAGLQTAVQRQRLKNLAATVQTSAWNSGWIMFISNQFGLSGAPADLFYTEQAAWR